MHAVYAQANLLILLLCMSTCQVILTHMFVDSVMPSLLVSDT